MLRNISGANYAVTQIIASALTMNQLPVAVPGTPLHRLAEACIGARTAEITYPDGIMGYDSPGSRECYTLSQDSKYSNPTVVEYAEDEENPRTLAISAHSVAYAAYVDDLAGVIARNLELAKGAAVLVNSAFDDIANKFKRDDVTLPISIKPIVGTGSLVNDDKLYRYAKEQLGAQPTIDAKKARAPSVFPKIDSLDEFPLLDLLKTNVSTLDEQLKEWALHGGAKLLLEMYNNFFTARKVVGDTNKGYYSIDRWEMSYAGDCDTPLDHYLGLLLLANKLLTLDLNLSLDLTLDQIESAMLSVRLFATANIVQCLDDMNGARKSKKLVYSYPDQIQVTEDWEKSERSIIVDGVLYAEFLADGGTPEMILGSYASSRWYFIKDLISNGPALTRAWDNGVAMITRQRQQSELARMLKVVRNRFFADFNALPDDHRAAIDTGTVSEALIHFSSHMTVDNVSLLHDHLRNMYTKVFYAGTLVHDLLKKIDSVKAETASDEASILEIAVIEFCIEYQMQMVTVIKAK